MIVFLLSVPREFFPDLLLLLGAVWQMNASAIGGVFDVFEAALSVNRAHNCHGLVDDCLTTNCMKIYLSGSLQKFHLRGIAKQCQGANLMGQESSPDRC